MGKYGRDLQHVPPNEMLQDFPAGLVAHPPRWAWGALLPSFGYGRCYLCRSPWWIATGHSVRYGFGGQFALCLRCWDGATIQQRIQAHAWITACWSFDAWPDWPLIEAAVRLDGREIELLGPELSEQQAELAREGAYVVLNSERLYDLAATLPRDRGTWQDRHVHGVVTRLRHCLDLRFDQVDVDHAQAAAAIAGSDYILTGPASVITWDSCHDHGVAALFFSPYAGWLLQPTTSGPEEFAPLIPRGGDYAPPPSVVVDELMVMLATGNVLWPVAA